MAKNEWEITVGDYVVYPTHGVGQVKEITEEKIANLKIEFLVILFAKNRMTLKIPVDKIEGWWTDVCGFVSCIAMAHADAFSDWANGFETPETTEFNEYNMQDVALGYTGAYPLYSNTRDSSWIGYKNYFIVGTGQYYRDTVNGREFSSFLSPKCK